MCNHRQATSSPSLLCKVGRFSGEGWNRWSPRVLPALSRFDPIVQLWTGHCVPANTSLCVLACALHVSCGPLPITPCLLREVVAGSTLNEASIHICPVFKKWIPSPEKSRKATQTLMPVLKTGTSVWEKSTAKQKFPKETFLNSIPSENSPLAIYLTKKKKKKTHRKMV